MFQAISNNNLKKKKNIEKLTLQWDLVCENNVWRTLVQVAVSAGKCIGASTAGIVSDKFGRRNAFAGGAVLYTAASILTTFSPWYWPFLIGRFFLGSSASGLFYPAIIMSIPCPTFIEIYTR